MTDGLSMSSRAEITKKYARGYAAASKKDKGWQLSVTLESWSLVPGEK